MSVMFEEHLADLESLIGQFPARAALTRHVYKDLVLNKLWKKVHVRAAAALDTCLIVAHEPNTPDDDQLVILPVEHTHTLSVDAVKTLFEQLRAMQFSNLVSEQKLTKLTLAIVGQDSTVMYYHLFDGLQAPKEHA
ncbi:Sen15 protein-domain-containing protein [Gongronella butleri]|nr:Sen15 protein-domain-containing protein [Gongronella butleri]